MDDSIVLERKENIAIVSFNRPASRNALSTEVLRKLGEVLIKLELEDDLRALIFHGAGHHAFCAGADLKERQTMTPSQTLDFVKLIGDTFRRITRLPMPTIAALNGDAFGGGLELALACDIRIASSHARMGLSECSLGVIPGAGGTQRLPLIVGQAKAMELIFLAKRISAQEALHINLINTITLDALEEALRWAEQITHNAPLAIRAAKKAMVESHSRALDQGLLGEQACYKSIVDSQDRLEGLKAFIEKRPPQFTGS